MLRKHSPVHLPQRRGLRIELGLIPSFTEPLLFWVFICSLSQVGKTLPFTSAEASVFLLLASVSPALQGGGSHTLDPALPLLSCPPKRNSGTWASGDSDKDILAMLCTAQLATTRQSRSEISDSCQHQWPTAKHSSSGDY